ncbi:DUF6221 family protein [Streptomyces aurantiogriseus]|uniref:Uncharacterized protein n=1 Tax=Streptomyces aurantiogriseus TaxID=66870 RepID=A0A918L068_9ACTN|nr:DUF6221 family protein [Streptomyces aurantiogriseus]GGR61254.1 hypothetical protein GCM10010251_92510 [Streptomyces aurantiogriseus]
MPDLHGWITQQIDEIEQLAKLIAPGGYAPDEWRTEPSRSGRWARLVAYSRLNNEPPEAAAPDSDQPVALVQTGRNEHLLIAMHDPAAVLRRCEADRRILARHRLNPDAYWANAAMCAGCGTYGEFDDPETDNLNDCPELLDLAHAHGLTDEILATLDRPKEGERPEPTGQSLVPDALYQAMAENMIRHFLGTRTVEPSPREKAIRILEPELKKIPGYVPITEEPGPA